MDDEGSEEVGEVGEVDRGVEVKVREMFGGDERMSKVVKVMKVEKNLLGFVKVVCDRCEFKEVCYGGWKVVVRERNGRKLFGLECEKRRLRVY